MQVLLLLCLLAPSWALVPTDKVVHPPLRVHLEPPPEELAKVASRNAIVYQTFMFMPVDHFDPQNDNTFLMRYMFNEEFCDADNCPIFIMVGGEWTISTGFLLTGNMYEMAKENKGYLIYTEHRYYGQTLPFNNFTAENLRYLNVDQALADLAYFIKNTKEQARFKNSPVILVGGSYAANMALWFKQRYPHLVKGVVASSGPIQAKADFSGYLESVHSAFLAEGGETCLETIRQGIAETVNILKTGNGMANLVSAYRLCENLNLSNAMDLGYFNGLITWSFSGSVQSARPGTIISVCNNFASNVYGSTPMEKIGGYIAAVQGLSPNGCWFLTYDSYVSSYQAPVSNSKAWYYQTCTEYGYFQIAPSSGTVFDGLDWLTVDFYTDLCQKVFDERFDSNYVYKAVEHANLKFGGLNPDVNNTINIHGSIDPWRALGVYDRDLKESSPTYDVPRASHCFDLQGWLSTDTIRMTNVQQASRRLVKEWLNEP